MVQSATDRKQTPDDRKLTSTSEAPELWGLKSSAFYERIKFLGIQPIKQGRKSFIDDEQITYLDELDAYIQEHGTMDGYEETGKLATVESGKVATQSEDEPEEINEMYSEPPTSEHQYAEVMQGAYQHRAGIEVAKYVIASQLAVEDLPADLQEEVNAARAATLPKSYSARETATSILKQFQQSKI